MDFTGFDIEDEMRVVDKPAKRNLRLEPLLGSTNDPEIERDSKLVDDIQKVLQENTESSVLLRPFVSQLKVTVEKARRSLKRRIEYNTQTKNQADSQISEPEIPQLFDLEIDETQEIMPKLGEYWSVKNSQDLFVVIETENPLSVKYFQPSVKGEFHRLNDTVYEILAEDLGKKISPPKIKNSGKFRQFYEFE